MVRLTLETYHSTSVISFYETDSVFLAILGCVLMCLENEAHLEYGTPSRLPTIEEISEALNWSGVEGRLVWHSLPVASSDRHLIGGSQTLDNPALERRTNSPSLSRIAAQSMQRQRIAGVLGWRPLNEWNPGARRMASNFHKLLSRVSGTINSRMFQ